MRCWPRRTSACICRSGCCCRWARLLAAFFGVLLGAPTLRLRGDYLAIVTLGFGEIIRIFLNNLNAPINITNGPQGVNLHRPGRDRRRVASAEDQHAARHHLSRARICTTTCSWCWRCW